MNSHSAKSKHQRRWLRCCFAGCCLGFVLTAGAQTSSDELRSAAAVRRLTVDEAQQPRQVRLRGVITFFDENLFSRFLQDETAGIYIYDSGMPVRLLPGQFVEVEGITSPGEFAPIVVPKQVRVLGEAPLPAPRQVTYERLATGIEDSQFVEIGGIVRAVSFHEASRHFLVEVATGGGRLSAYARQLPVERAEDLPDSTVRVRGVCSTKFNRQRQLFAIRLMVPRPEDLVVEATAPEPPFALPARPIGSLLQFKPQEPYGHRVKIAGTLICFEAGNSLVLQDGEHGIEVQTHGQEALSLGDRVEAVGFVGPGDYTPVLQDAVYRKISNGETVQPARVTPGEVLKGKLDCQLIQVSAKLLDRAALGEERYLVLQEDGFIFRAFLDQHNAQSAFAGLENGSRVAVTGVCRIDPGEWLAGEDWRAKSFRLQLRSIADVEVLKAPSWLTLTTVLWIAASVGALALAALSWVLVLRRQVTERTRQLETQIQERQRAERQRVVEQERTRVAQDLHDELGATLTEVSMLSTLARTPALPMTDRERYLEKLTHASSAVVATLDEIVWAVNPKYDSVASLASYYSLFAQRFLNLAGIACRLQVAENFPSAPLDARLRHGLFLAFKEALNNAVRHSGASQVLVEMGVAASQLRIAVTDDGRGFVPADCAPGSDGLGSMKARLPKLGGSCEIRSQPGKGTTVEFLLPLGESSP